MYPTERMIKMKENRYDDPQFFEKYSRMSRSEQGLAGAGEWYALRQMLPDFAGKRVLDLGCGYGWHCRYAVEQGAAAVVGVDLSQRMLERARQMTDSPRIEYKRGAIEDIDFPAGSFDAVISSLAFHYVEDFAAVCRKVCGCLQPGGDFVFSVEHPVFTAYGTQDWYRDENGAILHWPVDGYYTEGWRKTVFLGEEVTKYHKTLTTYLNSLLQNGFALTGVVEPAPTPEAVRTIPGMADELRRPMMLLVSACKR